MDNVIVCIAKNEDHYLEEWLRYNFKIGFDKIIIYQNNWRATIPIDLMQKVILINWDVPNSTSAQLNAYNDFIQKYWQQYNWAAFFDVDEFLVLKNNINLKKFLELNHLNQAICMHWRLFGDSGLNKVINGNYSCINRFTKSCQHTSKQVKTMINLQLAKNTLYMAGHICAPVQPKQISDNDAEIAHYMCKTWEEFLERRSGIDSFFYGKVDDFKNKNIKQMKKFFDGKNFNEIINTSVKDFYMKS